MTKDKSNHEHIEYSAIFASVILLLSFLWMGGYYEYGTVILGAITWVGGVFCYKSSRRNGIMQGSSWDSSLLFGAVLTIAYLIVCPYAVDSGMALIGVAKKSVVFIFAMALVGVSQEQRRKIVEKIPEMGFIVTAVGAVGSVIPYVSKLIMKAGRFSGTFGYANTYALLMLLGIIVLLFRFKSKRTKVDIAILIVLLGGLWFSGSRFTWILMILVLFVLAIYERQTRFRVLGLIGVIVTATVGGGLFLNQTEAMGRFFSTNLSTFYGRLLYWKDALGLIAKHPFGMGYLGYFYKQTEIQTGVYTVRYVHNDLLQWIMDIGWIPTILLVGILLYALWNKERPFVEKMLIGTILVHCFMEFDLEHTSILFLLVLLLGSTKEYILPSIKMHPLVGKGMVAFLGILCCYLAFPLSFYAASKVDLAAKWYPYYTDAMVGRLSQTEDIDEAERLSSKLLKQNDTIFLAYDMKAQIAYLNYEFEQMVAAKKEAIKRNKFDAQEYIDYLTMLNEALTYSQENEDTVLQNKVLKWMKEVPVLIENKKKTISELGNKIDDRVEIDLSDDIIQELKNLTE
ncbi:hypothetical protein lbkm_3632 [Lachnospiraceae bacterium KM106-2]|nr:hypothetical protein lbkm_3632 [Lachnospiraceae bacterium KM106-2]